MKTSNNTLSKSDYVVAIFESGKKLSLGQGWKDKESVERYLDENYPNKTGKTEIFVRQWVYEREHPTPHEGMTNADLDKLSEIQSMLSHSDAIHNVCRPRKPTPEVVSYRGGEEINSAASEWDLCVTIDGVKELDEEIECAVGSELVDSYADDVVNNILNKYSMDKYVEIVGAKKHVHKSKSNILITAYFRLCRENDDDEKIVRQKLQNTESVQAAYIVNERSNWGKWVDSSPKNEDVSVYCKLDKQINPPLEDDINNMHDGPYKKSNLNELVSKVVSEVNEELPLDRQLEIISVGQVITRHNGNYIPIGALSLKKQSNSVSQ